ncbi:MAG: AEC family transporter [Methanosphaera sp.]|nr:AEC family transporter [Methanosphaera sp.]
MTSSIEIILVPTILMVLGYVLKRINLLKPKDSNTLSKIVMKVGLPSLIFVNLSTASISTDMLILPVSSFFLSLICMVIALCYSRYRCYSKVKTWTIMIAVAVMNTAFVGFPITMGVYGTVGLTHAVFFDITSALIFVLFGIVLVTQFGGNRRDVIKTALSFMPLWAVVFGLIFNVLDINIGYVLDTTLNYLADATIPTIMLSLGLNLNFRDIRKYLGDSVFICAIRLVLAPVVMYVGLSLLGISGMNFNVAVLEAGMPTGMNALVLALAYSLDVDVMSSTIAMDTVLSLVSLTVIITFL